LGVLLEVELAALPGDGAKDGLARGSHAGVVVADDVGDAAQAALVPPLQPSVTFLKRIVFFRQS